MDVLYVVQVTTGATLCSPYIHKSTTLALLYLTTLKNSAGGQNSTHAKIYTNLQNHVLCMWTAEYFLMNTL